MGKISVINVKAYGDFNARYEVPVVAAPPEQAQNMCTTLNVWCKNRPECDMDIRLSHIFKKFDVVADLTTVLIDHAKINANSAKTFIDTFMDLCENHYIFVYPDNFSTMEITTI